jgi:hypothetical protein
MGNRPYCNFGLNNGHNLVSVDFGLETSAVGISINHMEAQVKCSPRKRVLNHLREGIATGVYPVGQLCHRSATWRRAWCGADDSAERAAVVG